MRHGPQRWYAKQRFQAAAVGAWVAFPLLSVPGSSTSVNAASLASTACIRARSKDCAHRSAETAVRVYVGGVPTPRGDDWSGDPVLQGVGVVTGHHHAAAAVRPHFLCAIVSASPVALPSRWFDVGVCVDPGTSSFSAPLPTLSKRCITPSC